MIEKVEINKFFDFNQKEIEITSKSRLLTQSSTWNRIHIVINNRIGMAWNPKHGRFDLEALIT